MLFSSLTFLLWFLPGVVLLHLLLPKPLKNPFLLASSVVFYAWGEIGYVPLVLGSMLLNWGLGFGAADARPWVKRLCLGLSLLVNMGSLLYFKYAGFLLGFTGLGALAPHPALPLGISFYSFQTQAYVIDVYRGRVPPEPSFVAYGAFILLFPQLIAGPIVLYTHVRKELKARSPQLEEGMALFIVGLAAKVLLANPLGRLWEQMRVLPAPSAPAAWLGILAFGLQIYFDFGGYSLMAIGMGRMLGFLFPANFNHPYAARSITEFWRRWHMTLGSWFREYVYFPMGGSRGSRVQTLRNLLVVWALTGLWHGASWNFLCWGLWFFVLIALERFCIGGFLRRHPPLALAYTLLAVLLGWVLFACDGLDAALTYWRVMFLGGLSGDVLFPLANNGVLLVLALACCAPPVVGRVKTWLWQHGLCRAWVLLGLLLLCVAALAGDSYNPFLYFRF